MTDSTAIASDAPGTGDAPNRGALSAFLEWGKPYRETIAILSAVVIALSGAAAWVKVYFATRAALQYMECRISSTTSSQVTALRLEQYSVRQQGIFKRLADLTNQGAGGGKEAQDLLVEAQNVSDSRDSVMAAERLARTESEKICFQELPDTSKSK